MNVLAVVVLVLGVDPFLGDGHHGAKLVTTQEVWSTSAAVTASTQPGAPIPLGSTTGFAPGDLVMAHVTSTLAAPSAPLDAGVVDVSTSEVGTYEFTRVVSVGPASLEVAPPLTRPLGVGAQVVLVAEFSSLTIADGGALTTQPWDGTHGGVLAVLVSGPAVIAGSIDVSGLGYRGGAAFSDMAGNAPETFGCTNPDEPHPRGGYKGESFFLQPVLDRASGLGRVASGGGGGVCHNAGGGGGGHVGAGGQGGASWSSDGNRDVGGRGGASVRGGEARLLFGGGGGAGEAHHGSLTGGGHRGGGVLFLRAASVVGGALRADGATATDSEDAAGGAGAGGTIRVESPGPISCSLASVRGGNGGINPCHCEGTSGGGGGGRVVLASSLVACPIDVRAGVGGNFSSGGSPDYRLSQPTAATRAQYDGLSAALGPLDASVAEPDAGMDAGSDVDAGTDGGTKSAKRYLVGCSTEGAAIVPVVLLLAVGLRRRRR